MFSFQPTEIGTVNCLWRIYKGEVGIQVGYIQVSEISDSEVIYYLHNALEEILGEFDSFVEAVCCATQWF